jgi:hypothetical protein
MTVCLTCICYCICCYMQGMELKAKGFKVRCAD